MIRLDLLMVSKRLVDSREKAKTLIREGKVKVNNQIRLKPSYKVDDGSRVELLEEFLFVSRAGYKLLEAINKFKINVDNKVCLDIGSSTGGFVDCLLKHKAKRVYAVDIAVGQLSEELINDERVINMEGIDLREGLILPEKVDFCSVDVTFVSSVTILKKIKKCLKDNASVIILIKPPYEVSAYKSRLKVNNKKVINNILKEIKKDLSNSYLFKGVIESPITGKKAGQKEYLMYLINKPR